MSRYLLSVNDMRALVKMVGWLKYALNRLYRINFGRYCAKMEKTMTKEELLSLAARAHGNLEYIEGQGWIHVDEEGKRGAWWNPLEDDSDAFKLIILFGIVLYIDYPQENVVTAYNRDGCDKSFIVKESSKESLLENSRLAIVKVAAKIGSVIKND